MTRSRDTRICIQTLVLQCGMTMHASPPRQNRQERRSRIAPLNCSRFPGPKLQSGKLPGPRVCSAAFEPETSRDPTHFGRSRREGRRFTWDCPAGSATIGR